MGIVNYNGDHLDVNFKIQLRLKITIAKSFSIDLSIGLDFTFKRFFLE